MAFVIFNLLCVAALVGLDQAIKFWAVSALQPVGAMPLIPHVVELRFVLNQGMAFSLLSGKQLFLIVATSAALLLVAYWLFFRAAAEDHVSLAQTDKVECVSQSVGRRCACRSGRVVRPMETIHNRNMTACNVCNHFRDEERIVFWSQFFSCECIRPGFFFKSVDSTDSHSEDYTYTVFVHSFQIQCRGCVLLLL